MSRRMCWCLALSAALPASQVSAGVTRGPSPHVMQQMQQIQQYQAIQQEMSRRQREGGGRAPQGEKGGEGSSTPRKETIPRKSVAGKARTRSQTVGTTTARKRTSVQTGKRPVSTGSQTAGNRRKPNGAAGGTTNSGTAMNRTPAARKRPVARPASAGNAGNMGEH